MAVKIEKSFASNLLYSSKGIIADRKAIFKSFFGAESENTQAHEEIQKVEKRVYTAQSLLYLRTSCVPRKRSKLEFVRKSLRLL